MFEFKRAGMGLLMSFIVAVTLTACGGGGGGSGAGSSGSAGPATLQTITVTPANPSVAAGTTQQMTATGHYSDNSTQDLTASVTWTSGTTSVATVTSPGGLVQGAAIGTSVITATSGAVSGNTTVAVTAATLTSITVTPASPTVTAGATQQMTATGHYSNGSTADITASVGWTSGTPSVATVTSPGGLVSGLAAGAAVITATSGAVSGNTTVNVTAATLTSITVTPASPTVTAGATQQMTATGHYSNGSTGDISASVGWTSGTPSVATVTSPGGLVQGVAAGSAVITATSGAVSGNTTVTVTAAINKMFVTNASSPSQVLVYSRTASGAATPLQNITGASTGLDMPMALSVDTVNNEIVVANASSNLTNTPSITVYAITATGNVAPLRTIVGAATGLCNPYGVYVDTVNNEILVANANLIGGCTPSITVYSRTASGNAAPLRTITGAATLLVNPSGLSVDTTNNEIFVAESSAANAMLVFSRTANGNVAPLRNVSGTSTGLNIPNATTVDVPNNEAFVANYGANSITVFGRTQTGNVVPARSLFGVATGLNQPFNASVDDVNNEIAVSNNGNKTITIYSRTAVGNTAPVRTISGYTSPNSVLQAPSWVQIVP